MNSILIEIYNVLETLHDIPMKYLLLHNRLHSVLTKYLFVPNKLHSVLTKVPNVHIGGSVPSNSGAVAAYLFRWIPSAISVIPESKRLIIWLLRELVLNKPSQYKIKLMNYNTNWCRYWTNNLLEFGKKIFACIL